MMAIHPEAPLVLFSIRPLYAGRILCGEKKWEFRKTRPKQGIRSAAIYATEPEQKIVALFRIGQIITDTPENLWESLKKEAGLCQSDFVFYFGSNALGHAIEILDLQRLDPPLVPRGDFRPPQSFYYTSLATITGKTVKTEKLDAFFH